MQAGCSHPTARIFPHEPEVLVSWFLPPDGRKGNRRERVAVSLSGEGRIGKLPHAGKGKREIVAMPGISRQQPYDMPGERKPVSPNAAALPGKLFGDGAAVRLRTEAACHAWHAGRQVDAGAIERPDVA